MKKVVYIITVVLLVLLIGQGAYANGPVPSGYEQEVLVDDCMMIDSIQIIGVADDEEGVIKDISASELRADSSVTKIESQRLISFSVKDYEKDIIYDAFYLVITHENGETITTNVLQADEYGTCLLDTENANIKRGVIENKKIGFFSSIFLFFVLLPPLFVTIIAEVLAGQIFKITEKKHIVIINCITNPIMNIIILRLLHTTIIDYWLIVLVMELVVLAVEFVYYIFMYKEYSKLKLALFSLAANTLSFGVYISISTLFDRLV